MMQSHDACNAVQNCEGNACLLMPLGKMFCGASLLGLKYLFTCQIEQVLIENSQVVYFCSQPKST